MIKRGFCLLVILFSFACKRPGRERNILPYHRATEHDSTIAVQQPDELIIADSLLYLKAVKNGKGLIAMTYRLKGATKDAHLSFHYFDYSDVVFPAFSVGLVGRDTFTTANYYLVQDSILILPLIGMSGGLTTYILNLQSGEEIANDIRTSFMLVWVNEKTSSFLMANTPLNYNDSVLLYKTAICKVENGRVAELKHDKVYFKEDPGWELDSFYKAASKLLH